MAEETANRLADYIRSGRSVPNAGANALRRLIGGVGDYAAERYNTARDTVANALYAAANPQEASQEFAAAVSRQPAPFQQVGEQDMETAMSYWNPAGLLGKIVWHGSPHKFTKFDASKIGTGEGAQAYGHGVYLADSPGVATTYVPKSGSPSWKGKDVSSYGMDGTISFSDGTTGKVADKDWDAFRKAMENGPRSGSLYKADLPDEWIPKMLDWDKPLAEQAPEVRAALQKLGEGLPDSKLRKGSSAIGLAESRLGSKAAAAQALREAGIPGIRYLDGGSRSAGQGSYNYVVFPGLEDQIKILERNGEPLNALIK